MSCTRLLKPLKNKSHVASVAGLLAGRENEAPQQTRFAPPQVIVSRESPTVVWLQETSSNSVHECESSSRTSVVDWRSAFQAESGKADELDGTDTFWDEDEEASLGFSMDDLLFEEYSDGLTFEANQRIIEDNSDPNEDLKRQGASCFEYLPPFHTQSVCDPLGRPDAVDDTSKRRRQNSFDQIQKNGQFHFSATSPPISADNLLQDGVNLLLDISQFGAQSPSQDDGEWMQSSSTSLSRSPTSTMINFPCVRKLTPSMDGTHFPNKLPENVAFVSSAESLSNDPVVSSTQPGRTYIDVDDIDVSKDVVFGQGNNHIGMKHWCDLCDSVHNVVDEHNSRAHAVRIVSIIHNKGGRFIDRKNKPAKLYVMLREEAIEWTLEALSRVHVVFDEDKHIYCGRGGLSIHNPANITWRNDIHSRLGAYNRSSRDKKAEISRNIVRHVYGKGGCFVTDENLLKNKFYIVPEAVAVAKTSQCLRASRNRDQSALNRKRERSAA